MMGEAGPGGIFGRWWWGSLGMGPSLPGGLNLTVSPHPVPGVLPPQVSRVLRPGGCFISITFAQPHFRKPHYAQEAFGWSLRHAACGDGDAAAFHYFLYIMRKGQPLDPPDLALGRRLHQPPPPPAPPPPLAPPDDDEDYLLAIQL